MLLALAERLPGDASAVLGCCSPVPPLVRQHVNELVALISKSLDESTGIDNASHTSDSNYTNAFDGDDGANSGSFDGASDDVCDSEVVSEESKITDQDGQDILSYKTPPPSTFMLALNRPMSCKLAKVSSKCIYLCIWRCHSWLRACLSLHIPECLFTFIFWISS